MALFCNEDYLCLHVPRSLSVSATWHGNDALLSHMNYTVIRAQTQPIYIFQTYSECFVPNLPNHMRLYETRGEAVAWLRCSRSYPEEENSSDQPSSCFIDRRCGPLGTFELRGRGPLVTTAAWRRLTVICLLPLRESRSRWTLKNACQPPRCLVVCSPLTDGLHYHNGYLHLFV